MCSPHLLPPPLRNTLTTPNANPSITTNKEPMPQQIPASEIVTVSEAKLIFSNLDELLEDRTFLLRNSERNESGKNKKGLLRRELSLHYAKERAALEEETPLDGHMRLTDAAIQLKVPMSDLELAMEKTALATIQWAGEVMIKKETFSLLSHYFKQNEKCRL